jgi:hypothetical protein
MQLKLSNNMKFEHVEYILKQTPNLRELHICGSYNLISVNNKWELLLSVQCPKLVTSELVCTGLILDYTFDKAVDDFKQECATQFWLERNVTIIHSKTFSVYSYCSSMVQFNTKKVSFVLRHFGTPKNAFSFCFLLFF